MSKPLDKISLKGMQVPVTHDDNSNALILAIDKLTKALEKKHSKHIEFSLPLTAQAFVFEAEAATLRPIKTIVSPNLSLLHGIDRSKAALLKNSETFAKGFPANNALLWGARGMGKSTLIKSIQKHLISTFNETAPILIEIHREDISHLPSLMNTLRLQNQRFILFCDDLSFSRPDRDFKALKSVLEGGLDGRPENVIFYATSNRRHLLPREIADQETAIGIHPNESMDETIALSDRFGLWLGFHAADQADYIKIIKSYMAAYKLNPVHDWKHEALEWAKTRGNLSGRTAWQYLTNLAGQLNIKL